jgi:hypothetical protein
MRERESIKQVNFVYWNADDPVRTGQVLIIMIVMIFWLVINDWNTDDTPTWPVGRDETDDHGLFRLTSSQSRLLSGAARPIL